MRTKVLLLGSLTVAPHVWGFNDVDLGIARHSWVTYSHSSAAEADSTSWRRRNECGRGSLVRRFGLFDGLFGGAKKEEITDAEAREKYGVQLPKYEAIAKEGYELRRYQTMSVAECNYEARPEGYELLGGYSSGGENALDLPMPKTCPCVMSPCLTPKTMFYVLPSPHTPLEPSDNIVPPPAPLDPSVRVKTVEALTVAVIKFSGYATPDVVFGKRDECKGLLARDGVAYDAKEADTQLMMAQYNELFSLPWNRDNEVWLPIVKWPE